MQFIYDCCCCWLQPPNNSIEKKYVKYYLISYEFFQFICSEPKNMWNLLVLFLINININKFLGDIDIGIYLLLCFPPFSKSNKICWNWSVEEIMNSNIMGFFSSFLLLETHFLEGNSLRKGVNIEWWWYRLTMILERNLFEGKKTFPVKKKWDEQSIFRYFTQKSREILSSEREKNFQKHEIFYQELWFNIREDKLLISIQGIPPRITKYFLD